MKRSRYSDEQIAYALHRAERRPCRGIASAGPPSAADVSRRPRRRTFAAVPISGAI
jgi:hypothetical protein